MRKTTSREISKLVLGVNKFIWILESNCNSGSSAVGNNFWQVLRYLQRYTIGTRLEMNVRLWEWKCINLAVSLRFSLVWLREESPASHLFTDARLIVVVVLFGESNTSITIFHKSRASNPSLRSQASGDMISDSVELYDTDVWFLRTQQIGSNVRHPKIPNYESSKSPAKSESWNRPNGQCCAAFPTRKSWRQSLVRWMSEMYAASHLSQACVHFGDCWSKFVDWS